MTFFPFALSSLHFLACTFSVLPLAARFVLKEYKAVACTVELERGNEFGINTVGEKVCRSRLPILMVRRMDSRAFRFRYTLRFFVPLAFPHSMNEFLAYKNASIKAAIFYPFALIQFVSHSFSAGIQSGQGIHRRLGPLPIFISETFISVGIQDSFIFFFSIMVLIYKFINSRTH